jgi:glutamine phosphoribosylpyrophosphate amidotransferase
MCGVIGFITKNRTQEQINLLKNLIIQSKIRGLHSFGYSFYNDKTITTRKFFKIEDIINDINKCEYNTLIYHNRYSTSGDWKIIENNQPITSEIGSIAMNGVLSMKPKEEYEKEFNVKCKTANDAEIILRLLEKPLILGFDLERFLEVNKEWSFASVMLLKNQLWAIRNNKRPLYWFEFNNAVYVISTMDIVDRALSENIKLEVIPPFEWININEKL